jgi:hypothetical protein
MTKATLTIAACATLLCARTAPATPSPQQNCDSARTTAWKVYVTCVYGVVVKETKGATFDEFGSFARCRHAYFKNWKTFQTKTSLAGTTCIGLRYADNGDQTVTDHLSGLVWEKKDTAGGIHDKGNLYSWSTGTNKEDGTTFTSFLGTVNSSSGFAGSNGWRPPTMVELQTIVLDFTCTGVGTGPTCSCPSSPCVDPALDAANTKFDGYYSAAPSLVFDPGLSWVVGFADGDVTNGAKTDLNYVRVVREGL